MFLKQPRVIKSLIRPSFIFMYMDLCTYNQSHFTMYAICRPDCSFEGFSDDMRCSFNRGGTDTRQLSQCYTTHEITVGQGRVNGGSSMVLWCRSHASGVSRRAGMANGFLEGRSGGVELDAFGTRMSMPSQILAIKTQILRNSTAGCCRVTNSESAATSLSTTAVLRNTR